MSTKLPSSAPRFARELLERPSDDRLAYFKAHTVAHSALTEIDGELIDAINEPANASLLFVFGPPGVGKTTLRHRVVKRITEEALASPVHDAGHIPVVSVDAKAAELSEFSWKDYYKRALLAMDEPLIENKADYEKRNAKRNRAGHLIINGKSDTAELRHALEETIKYRQPKAIIIDDAQHMARLPSGRKLQDQLDCIKSLADITKTVHVLLGSYDLLKFRHLSGQLSRRSRDFHFPRYHCDAAEEVRVFKSVVWDFQRHLPLHEEPDLGQYWDFLYERSIGCVGVLKDWLVLCLRKALKNDAASLTFEHLEKSAFSVSQCMSMATEAIEGEQAFSERQGESNELRRYIKLTDPPRGLTEGQQGGGKEKSEGRTVIKNSVGRRKPTRDRVGS